MAVALITGAGSGIGAATARRLADDGAEGLALTDVDKGAADAVAAEIARDELEVLSLDFDAGDPQAWAEAEDAVRQRFGGIDRLVANAGIGAAASLTEMTFEDWRRVQRVNLDGVFLTLKHGLRLMRDGGAAVVVSSATGLKPEVGTAAYGSSKAAVIHLAKIAAKEQAARGVRVNAVCPGGVQTPIWDAVPAFSQMADAIGRERAFDKMAGYGTPMKRFAAAEEIAATIAWLLGEESRYMTGSVIVSDGGYSL